MDLRFITDTDTITTIDNFFVFEYNINTIEHFTDIDNSINKLFDPARSSQFSSIAISNLDNTNDYIKIESNNDGTMKLIFY